MKSTNDDLKPDHLSIKEMTVEEDKLAYLTRTSRELAHQLNNLLTAILANIQLLSLMIEHEELKPYVVSVEDATRDAAEIVHDFQKSVRTLARALPQESVLDGGQQSSR